MRGHWGQLSSQGEASPLPAHSRAERWGAAQSRQNAASPARSGGIRQGVGSQPHLEGCGIKGAF